MAATDSITLVHADSGKRYKVSARNPKSGAAKDVTVASIRKNFAPILHVDPDVIAIYDEHRIALSDDEALQGGCVYHMESVRKARTGAATSDVTIHRDPAATPFNASFVTPRHTPAASSSGAQLPPPSSRSASATRAQQQHELATERARELQREKERLLHQLQDVSTALEHEERRSGSREASVGNHRQPSPRLASSAAPSTRESPGATRRADIFRDSKASTAAAHAAMSSTSLDDQIRDVEYQITVVESLLQEDGAQWNTEIVELEAQLRRRRETAMDTLAAQARELNHSAASVERENDALSREVEQLRRRLEDSNEHVLRERRTVDSATKRLEAAKRSIVDLLGRFGATDDKDNEMADFVAHTAAQKHALTRNLEQVIAENGRLRAEYERVSRERKTLHKQLEDLKGNIRVVVRMRPVLPSDAVAPHHAVQQEEGNVEANEQQQAIFVWSPTTGLRNFEFYAVYGPSDDSLTQQGALFEEQVVPLLDSVFDGNNACVLAYGQTGSGKSFTIIGETADGNLTGLLPQSVEYLFDPSRNTRLSDDGTHQERVSTVSMTMIELYMDSVMDLIPLVNGSATASKKCDVRQLPGSDGVSIVGAEEVVLQSWEHAMDLIQRGIGARQTHRTLRNPVSSRSHLLLTVSVTTSDGHRSKLVFVDLAGSERVSRSLSQGDRLKEAQHINKSLSALGDVVASLTTNANGHIPYRNSKLTQLLQNCIGGNAKTLMVTCICPHIPHQHNLMETVSTLKFASRAKLVRNNVTLRRGNLRRPVAGDGDTSDSGLVRLPSNLSHASASSAAPVEELDDEVPANDINY